MNLTYTGKLLTSPEQSIVLQRTMERFNDACNFVSSAAVECPVRNRVALHNAAYYRIRDMFGLPAQIAIRVIGKVAGAYKGQPKHGPCTFRRRGSIDYDGRSILWRGNGHVSILTVNGRETIPITFGKDRLLPEGRRLGGATLYQRGGAFFLSVYLEIETPPIKKPKKFLGVDLGIVNIAADSDGVTYSGSRINNMRRRHCALRDRLQKKGTTSAKRLLKKRRRKETLYVRDVNHRISKELVTKAKGTGRGISLENLHGIRDRLTVRKAQRRTQHSWSFFQLQSFIKYKAERIGVFVAMVDPRNTSRTCPRCNHVSKSNRRTQALFSCVSCGFAGPADTIAATNIRSRADCHTAIRGGSNGLAASLQL